MLAAAREMPTWRSRQLAAWLTDHRGLSVSASTVYRILRREGLVKRIEYQLAAGKEYQHKTTGPHQLWATDASYFRVVGWGYYYLVTVMDDYSRFILAWKVQRDMTADSLIEVVQEAVDSTGMTDVPLEDRTKLLSDNGSGYVSRAFREYMRVVGIRHVLAAPYHPQTNGKSRVPGSGVRGRGSGERETTGSSLAGKEESSRKEDNSGQGKDGPAGAIAQGGNGR